MIFHLRGTAHPKHDSLGAAVTEYHSATKDWPLNRHKCTKLDPISGEFQAVIGVKGDDCDRILFSLFRLNQGWVHYYVKGAESGNSFITNENADLNCGLLYFYEYVPGISTAEVAHYEVDYNKPVFDRMRDFISSSRGLKELKAELQDISYLLKSAANSSVILDEVRRRFPFIMELSKHIKD